MKSSPYVYPYVPFADLSNKEILDNFGTKKIINDNQLEIILQKISQPQIKIDGKNMSEKIFSLFLHDAIYFGDIDLIRDLSSYWIKKIQYFIDHKEPIRFTLLGFPFKVPVPLKTNRVLPDLGELLILNRLEYIAQLIHNQYSHGVEIVIFTEGAFGPFVGVSQEESDTYKDRLIELNRIIKNQYISIYPLSDMEQTVSDFPIRFNNKADEVRDLIDSGDKKMLMAYQGAYDSIYRIVSTREDRKEILLDVYNDQQDNKNVSKKITAIRRRLQEQAHNAVIHYHAYLKVRDDITFLEKTVPHALALSVSPKPYRLGILPISKDCIRLPYHAVPVFNPKINQFLLEYLIDIQRDNATYIPVHLEGDTDPAPFFYEKIL